MALLPQSLDYTDKDFDAIRARLIALLRSVFPTWTDYNILQFGNILMECFAFVGDTLGFYQDAQSNESRWTRATQRASIINLAKLIGYSLPGATAASVDVKVTLSSGVTAGSVTFDAGTICRTREVTDPIRFQMLSQLVIAPGADPPEGTVTVENSESRNEVFSSSGLPDQAFLLSGTPYLDDSTEITTVQGTWEQVDSFLDSTGTDRHFTVSVDQNDRATIRFGDGTNGLIPEGTITTDYKIGGGSDGNVEPEAIRVVEGAFTDSFGTPVSVECINEISASGGSPRQSIETARVAGPASIRAPRTTVAREDYEINALKVAGVARALMLSSDQEPLIAENSGFLYIIPFGGGQPSQALKDAVLESVTVTFPNTITFRVTVEGTVFLVINVQATVYLNQGVAAATAKTRIETNLQEWFAITTVNEEGEEVANPNVDYGWNFKDADGNPAGEIAFSDVFNVVRDTVGVRKIGDRADDFLLNGAARDVPIDPAEFPKLGTVTLINGDTGLPL